MNRSRKILKLLRTDSILEESDNNCDSVLPNTSNKNIFAVTNIKKYGYLSPDLPNNGSDGETSQAGASAQRKAVSPLPPGAEEISAALHEVWNDILEDEREYNAHTPSPESTQGIESPKLAPFSSEVIPNFESSPNIISFDDLENIYMNRSATPASAEMRILTPMPSPVNVHKACNNEFCPNTKCALNLAFPLISSIGSPLTPQSVGSIVTPRTTKKRQRHQKEWSDVKRKCLKNLGQKYVTKKGKVVDEKTLGPTCKCRYKCSDKITHQERVDCFSKYWQLGEKTLQWNFVIKYSEKLKKKRCLNQDAPNNRKFSYKYYLPLITESDEGHCEKVEVCQNMFINTLAVSTRTLKTAWKKYDGSAIIEQDKRGRHDNHKTIITDAMILSVCDHVRAFVPVESHYIRKDSQKLYLPGDLSISKMHKLYLEWYDPEKFTCKAEKERQYRDIVNSNFNISFHIPKKDQCNDCHAFRKKKHPTDEEKRVYEEHQENKQLARDLKGRDKKDAIESNGKVCAVVFDFQKVLSCPHGKLNIYYYKRKLSCLNFTVYDMGKKRAVCYMWDETVLNRGANEVSSCLLDYIEAKVDEGVKDFRFWSDNCPGQNRNRIVFSLIVYAAKKYNIAITHRFLQKNHTQNEGDSVHAVIERASQHKDIYTPDEWRLLVKWAKSEEPQYVVRNMTQNDVLDFKAHINDKAWLKNSRGQKIQWSNIREIYADGNDPNKLFYKYNLAQTDYDVLILRGNTRNSIQIQYLPAYSEPLKLSKEKYKDLVDMCNSHVIPSEYHAYFKSLPHH